jgi:formylglycine-generating enzyme required for sulfatase activity
MPHPVTHELTAPGARSATSARPASDPSGVGPRFAGIGLSARWHGNRMGSDRTHYPEEEAPAHRVTVDGFWMDQYPVTNEAFARFVAENRTRHVRRKHRLTPTTIRARCRRCCMPARSVFRSRSCASTCATHRSGGRSCGAPVEASVRAARHDQRARSATRWCTSRTRTPRRSRRGRARRCPTESEWERAARGWLDGGRVRVGRGARPARLGTGRNTWQGEFPWQNASADGFDGTSPVDAFPPNGYGLYDMIGNVWEWTRTGTIRAHPAERAKACCIPRNPRGRS